MEIPYWHFSIYFFVLHVNLSDDSVCKDLILQQCEEPVHFEINLIGIYLIWLTFVLPNSKREYKSFMLASYYLTKNEEI